MDKEKMNQMMVEMNNLKREHDDAIKELESREFTSFVASGQIKLKMLGNFTVKSIHIDKAFFDSKSEAEVSDAVALAFNNVKYDIDSARKEIETEFNNKSVQMLRDLQLSGVDLGGGF